FMQRMDPEDSKLRLMSLGILPEKAEKIRALGLDIVPRAYCYSSLNGEKFARAVIDGYRDNGIYDSQPSYFLAGGEAVPGYDEGVDLIAGYIAEKGLSVGLIEDTTQLQNIKQDGVLDLVGLGRGAVRVFSVWDYIQNRYQYYGYEGAKEIENTMFRAVTERNIRVIYYKPIREFKDFHTYVTDVDEYVEMFSNLRERLAEHGISFGSAAAMPDFTVSFASKLLIALGCAASGILLLGIIFPVPERWKLILMVAAALCVLGSFYVLPNTTELIASLMSALIFACLAVTVCVKAARMAYDGGGDAVPPVLNAIINGILALFAVTAVALAGGIMTAAPLSSVSYMLEIDIFRGVKVAQILPLVFFIGAYLAFFGSGETPARRSVLRLGDVKSLLSAKINVWMAIIAVAAAVAGQYYLMRTGHESVEVSGVEMLFRNTLEELLLARPRTKEFLAGFPAVMLAVYAAGRRLRFWTVAFGLCGVIGATSVINTFMHIRTPLYLGFARTGFSVFFGAIAGIVAVLIFHALFAAYRSLKKRYGGET
ncbi:MAG: DUF5693 family protein, partial [Oscillospiraceae bacterium]|nr:DUF5693 family protein [Oscillospiraceae bacterium]